MGWTGLTRKHHSTFTENQLPPAAFHCSTVALQTADLCARIKTSFAVVSYFGVWGSFGVVNVHAAFHPVVDASFLTALWLAPSLAHGICHSMSKLKIANLPRMPKQSKDGGTWSQGSVYEIK
eukprot:4343300-Amphidinium_carterae.1